jgi:hypothetical protein
MHFSFGRWFKSGRIHLKIKQLRSKICSCFFCVIIVYIQLLLFGKNKGIFFNTPFVKMFNWDVESDSNEILQWVLKKKTW